MASLSLSHFISFPSIFPRRHYWHPQHQQLPHELYRFRAFSINKSRRKVMTNAELCDDIREFIAVNGLPQGNVPTMKEFSQLGRSDLAYIVRRRGYKLIGELLGNMEETDSSGSNAENGIAEENNALGDGDDKVTGQYDKPADTMFEHSASFVEVPAMGSCSDSLKNDDSHAGLESSAKFENDVPVFAISENKDVSLESKLPVMENHVDSSDVGPPFESGNYTQEIFTDANFIDDGRATVEASDDLSSLDTYDAGDGLDEQSIEESYLASSDIGPELTVEASTSLSVDSLQNGQYENMNVVKEVALSSEVFADETLFSSASGDKTHISDEHIVVSVELSSMSLEDKVANFMQHGHLDTVEESDPDGLSKERGITEYIEQIDEEVQIVNSTSVYVENLGIGGTADTNFNGSALNSMQTATTENPPLRDVNLSVEGQNTQLNDDMDNKTIKMDNSVEINHLKFMLHEKELELSQLKEQIEKEKRALTLLQAKAETEISKAKKLISEKDAELLAAEEMLSELVEVQIRYHGDGEMVEVAGSFNGWHHWIKMDPQPPSSIIDPADYRDPKVWSTVLWLYPGIYEIKFIVDGEWKIDPRMESVSNGTICNNILRVQR